MPRISRAPSRPSNDSMLISHCPWPPARLMVRRVRRCALCRWSPSASCARRQDDCWPPSCISPLWYAQNATPANSTTMKARLIQVAPLKLLPSASWEIRVKFTPRIRVVQVRHDWFLRCSGNNAKGPACVPMQNAEAPRDLSGTLVQLSSTHYRSTSCSATALRARPRARLIIGADGCERVGCRVIADWRLRPRARGWPIDLHSAPITWNSAAHPGSSSAAADRSAMARLAHLCHARRCCGHNRRRRLCIKLDRKAKSAMARSNSSFMCQTLPLSSYANRAHRIELDRLSKIGDEPDQIHHRSQAQPHFRSHRIFDWRWSTSCSRRQRGRVRPSHAKHSRDYRKRTEI